MHYQVTFSSCLVALVSTGGRLNNLTRSLVLERALTRAATICGICGEFMMA